jgi:2'-hydroxyisoflavone reductase
MSSTFTRRDFMHASLTVGAAAALGPAASALGSVLPRASLSLMPRLGAGKRILILGGTGFLGPAVVEVAKARGHSLTLFNRGRTEKRIGFIDGVEHLYGNRDPKLPADETRDAAGNYINPSPMGLESLAAVIADGTTWDAVVDTSAYYPRMVRASTELLAPAAKQYILISSVSVYADNATPNQDESAALGTIADPTVETMGSQFENYGPLKALCEQAAEAAFPGRTANIRPGLIVGPGDPTDRFTYWPLRAQRGGEILAPGSPDDPVQLIDVRDLAEWIITLIETNTSGVFNAINPGPGDYSIGKTIDACRAAAKKLDPAHHSSLTWVAADFLEQQQVTPWGDMPLWIPPTGDSAGFHLRTNARAVATGLKFRPVEDTAAAILAWWPKEVERRIRVTEQMKQDARNAGQPEPQMADPKALRGGLSAERENLVLEAWKNRDA